MTKIRNTGWYSGDITWAISISDAVSFGDSRRGIIVFDSQIGLVQFDRGSWWESKLGIRTLSKRGRQAGRQAEQGAQWVWTWVPLP